MGYSSLARVLTGWAGTIAAVITADNVLTITPRVRESAASILARLVAEMTGATGNAPTLTVSASGVITLANWDAAIILTFSGNCDNRTGFTAGGGIYGGSTSYTAAGAFDGAYVPAYGLRLNGTMLATTRTGSVGDGDGGVSPIQESAQGQLVIWDDEINRPTSGYEYDVWHDGRVFGRVLVDGIRWSPLSRSLRTSNAVRLDLDIGEVA